MTVSTVCCLFVVVDLAVVAKRQQQQSKVEFFGIRVPCRKRLKGTHRYGSLAVVALGLVLRVG
jgi:hypothetical protein